MEYCRDAEEEKTRDRVVGREMETETSRGTRARERVRGGERERESNGGGTECENHTHIHVEGNLAGCCNPPTYMHSHAQKAHRADRTVCVYLSRRSRFR